ncbi:uncharacterized protein C8R40DRAFT_1068870 [Lentinula edodes]|uniref:uncharacterized protein n=1 Tax=Lentinula edodes TaxID=5353 RepID=UPI001E8D302A|nr:uncharacterized protein C8R40DRAFT_1068870 [Lentinula edodes]KAH7876066.1 hypothetical protein C8R40DRAFT_1068870 [Lentinula edodes]
MLSLLLREKVFVLQFSPLDLNAYQRLFHQLVGEACWAFLFGIIIGPYGANIFLIPNLNFLSSLAVAAFSRQQLSAVNMQKNTFQHTFDIFWKRKVAAMTARPFPFFDWFLSLWLCIGENLAPKYCFPERSQRHCQNDKKVPTVFYERRAGSEEEVEVEVIKNYGPPDAHSSLFQGERAEAQRHFKEDLGRLRKAVDDNPAETRRRQKKM